MYLIPALGLKLRVVGDTTDPIILTILHEMKHRFSHQSWETFLRLATKQRHSIACFKTRE